MKKLFLATLLAITPAISVGQTHKGISLQLYIMKQNGQPMNQNQLSVRSRIVSTNDCVLLDETHSNVDIVNGYMRIAVGQGVRGSSDKGLALVEALSNSLGKSGLDPISGAAGSCSVSPGPQDPRKLKVTFNLNSDAVEANFTIRSSAYAVVADEATTLQGKLPSDMIQKNAAKNLTQLNLENFLNTLVSNVGKGVKFDGSNFVAYDPAEGSGGGGPVDLSGYLKADGSVQFSGNLEPAQPDSYIVGTYANPINGVWMNVGHLIDGGNYRGSISGTPDGIFIQSSQEEKPIVLSPNGTAPVDVTGHRISNLANPTGPQDAVPLSELTSQLSNKADAIHGHNASDITAGILSISQGGTGASFLAPNSIPVMNGLGTGMTGLTCQINEILKFDGTVWACAADAAGSTVADASFTAKGIVQLDTNANTSGLTINAGVIKVNAGTGPHQIVKLEADGSLPALVGSYLTGLNGSNIQYGAVPVNHGGTGGTSKTVGFDNLSPMSAAGDMIIGSTDGSGSRLAKGSDGQILTMISGLPAWSSNITAGEIIASKQIAGATFNTTANASILDFGNGNTVVSQNTCGATLTLSNLKDGGTYTFVNTDTTSSTQCNFQASGLTFKFSPANGARTSGTMTVYSFLRAGSFVFVSWGTGFQ